MVSLIYKDLLNQKSRWWLLLFYGAFMHLALMAMPGIAAYTGAAVGVTYVLLLETCARDEKNNSDKLLISLPVKRSSLVFAKYLAGMLFITAGLVISAITGSVVHYAGGPRELINLETVVSILLGGAVMVAAFLPIYFKLGMGKARLLQTMIFLLIFFVPGTIVNLLNEEAKAVWLTEFLAKLDHNQEIVVAVVVGMFLLGFATSLLLSVRFYRNREFV